MNLKTLLFLPICLHPSPLHAQRGVFDAHVHLHRSEDSIRDYEARMGKGLHRVTGYAAMWFGGPNQALEGSPDRIRIENDKLMELAKRHSSMLPVASIHPYDGAAALEEIQRVAALGFKVLKLHAHTQRFDVADARVLAAVRKAGDLSLIVMMDNASILPGDCEKLFNLALAAQKTKFIFAHLGGLNFRFWNILKAARTAKGLFGENIYFDISATVAIVADSPLKAEFVWTLRNVGIEHVLLGSDYPQYSLAQNIAALDQLGLSSAEKAKIRFQNARRLFGLTAEPK